VGTFISPFPTPNRNICASVWSVTSQVRFIDLSSASTLDLPWIASNLNQESSQKPLPSSCRTTSWVFRIFWWHSNSDRCRSENGDLHTSMLKVLLRYPVLNPPSRGGRSESSLAPTRSSLRCYAWFRDGGILGEKPQDLKGAFWRVYHQRTITEVVVHPTKDLVRFARCQKPAPPKSWFEFGADGKSINTIGLKDLNHRWIAECLKRLLGNLLQNWEGGRILNVIWSPL
jgi:hypothetical protein